MTPITLLSTGFARHVVWLLNISTILQRPVRKTQDYLTQLAENIPDIKS